MKISSLSPGSNSRLARPSVIDDIARRSLFRLIRDMEGGTITVTENGVTHQFGDGKSSVSGEAPINVNVVVNNPAFYRMTLLRGSIGAGEAFMLRFWETNDLTGVVRMMCRNMRHLEKLDGFISSVGVIGQRFKHWLSPNSIGGAKKNIHAHYDLSNDLFEYFLDSRMMYSAAVYPEQDSDLETAAAFKLHEVGRKLDIGPEDHVVEIGSGWGGMAIYLAEHFGCKVTTTTISNQQFEYAREEVTRRGLAGQVTVLDKDYRELKGQYDKLVSIEMIEAVGQRYLGTYFQQCNSLLKRRRKDADPGHNRTGTTL